MTKQARTMSDARYAQALKVVRGDARDWLMFALSVKAGLRAKEIAGLTWDNVDFEERVLRLKTTKGDKPRSVPMSKEVVEAFIAHGKRGATRHEHIFVNSHAKPGEPLTPNAVANWFRHLYIKRLGWEGYSSHSGRRTFCTNTARKITSVGGSLKDIQSLMGHESLQTTQKYIDSNEDAQRKVVDL